MMAGHRIQETADHQQNQVDDEQYHCRIIGYAGQEVGNHLGNLLKGLKVENTVE